MTIVKDGYPFIFWSIVAAAPVYYFFGLEWAVVPLLLAAYFAYFFRNPERPLPDDSTILYSPADGRVMKVEEIYDEEFLLAKAHKVTIFLSVFNVHVNRSPLAGEIKYQRYNEGKFVPAFDKEAGFKNERHAIGIDTGTVKVMVTQVAGLLARRIVSWVSLGTQLKQGQCYGMIKFGSSTEIVMPVDVEVLVHKGQNVIGGITPVGRIRK